MKAAPRQLSKSAVDALLSRATPAVADLARAVRQLVRNAAPGCCEVIYHGALCYGRTERRSMLQVYISFHTSHVNLGFYHGAHLTDPERLMEGDGKQMRHIKIRASEDIRRVSFEKLIRQALQP